MQRRGFFGACASVAAMGTLPAALARAAGAPVRLYGRVRLTGADGTRLEASRLRVGESYVFNYPYVTTPCFLLDLGRPVQFTEPLSTQQGERYVWPGGVGPQRALVAFSAICAHKMSHPSKSISFINYRHEEVSFRGGDESLVRRKGVIFCCSEKSAYDPARGARVLGGPARQPLCTILIEHDPAEDALYALGSYGGEMFEEFFQKFAHRLQLEWGIADVQARVEGSTAVVPISEYSRDQMMCGA
jgi:Rieske Fe-S protein